MKPVHVHVYKGSSCTSVSFVRAGDTVVFHQQEKVSPIYNDLFGLPSFRGLLARCPCSQGASQKLPDTVVA